MAYVTVYQPEPGRPPEQYASATDIAVTNGVLEFHVKDKANVVKKIITNLPFFVSEVVKER